MVMGSELAWTENAEKYRHTTARRVVLRFAILWRNKWMLKQSDYVVAYVTHSWGGAAQFTAEAYRLGKMVLEVKNCNN